MCSTSSEQCTVRSIAEEESESLQMFFPLCCVFCPGLTFVINETSVIIKQWQWLPFEGY